MAGFLDPSYEAILTGLPDNFGLQTLDFVNNVLKGLYYASMSVVTRTVTGQVKKGDGTNYTAAVSVNLFCDQVMTVNVGTTTTIGNSSIQVTTNASGVFQVTIAGSQGATLIATVTGGVGVVAIIGSGGTGGGFGGGGGGGGAVTDGNYGDVTVSGTGTIWTINANSVSFSKFAQIPTDTLLGRDTAGTGNVESISVSGGLEFTGSGGIQRSALTGDVTASAGSGVTAIGTNKVLNSMLRQSAGVSVIGRSASTTGNVADITAADDNQYLKRDGAVLFFDYLSPASISSGVTTARIMGRVTAGTGALEQLTGTQATTLLDVFTSTLKGLVPAPVTSTGKFLKDDATWGTPLAAMTIGGTVTSGTAGSILFVGTGPVLAQNNTAFFWENTNKVLKITQSAADPLDGTGAITLQNTLSTSVVQISWRHNNAAFIASLGHNNASGADGGMYFDIESATSTGLFFASVVGGNHMQIFSGAAGGAGFQLWSGVNTVVSDANTGRLRYNPTGQKFQMSVNTGAYLDVPLLAAALSTGSVLFADSSGRIAQDNADFRYDATNNKLAIGTSAVSNTTHALDVSQAIASDTPAFFWNTSTSGYSGIGWNDSTPVYKGSLGYGNAAATIVNLRNLNFFASAAVDYVFCDVSTGVNVVTTRVSMTSGSAGLEFSNGSSWAAAGANLGRIRYNTTGQKFQMSGNSVAFKDVGLLAAALVTGSIPFSDSTGALAANNANFFFDTTNVRLGIGANAFSTNAVIGGGLNPALTVRNTGSTRPATILIESFDATQYPTFIGYRSRGTPASPSPVLNSDILFLFQAYGQQNTTVGHIVNAGYMRWEAAENWSGSAHGSRLGIWTVQNTTVTVAEKLAIENDGGITYANSASAAVSAASTARIRYDSSGQALQVSNNAVAYKNISLLAAALTTGSVPFADSSGALAQDNTNHYWDNTNKRLSLGAGTSPAVTLSVKNATTAQAVAQLEHSAVAGYAAVSLINSAAANQGMVGYGNASVALTHLQSKNFLHSTGPVWAVSNATGVALTFYPVSGSAGIGMADGASLAVSAAGEARIIYNSATNKLQISKNGAAYIDII